ncbi:MAG: hypothetical protein IKS17_10815 [Firmicutes bacterium]|nr:hypothetical protein [Bacillota bacterium]
MRYRCICSKPNTALLKKFLALPAEIYGSAPNRETEEKILNGTHILSGYFDIIPFAVLDENRRLVNRCILAHYKGEDKAYIGFFEALDNVPACRMLFASVESRAKSLGIKRLIGPYNCSLWLGSRLKLDKFEDTYTGEPFNPHYYPKLWRESGFEIFEQYHSNIYKIPDTHNEKCRRRLEFFKTCGYEFTHMTSRDYCRQLGEIYELLSRVYSGFPEYRDITKAEFIALYTPLKKMLNLKRDLLVYKDGKLAAFMIAFPDYSRAKNIFDRARIKHDPQRLVFMYLGADPSHMGLGSALAELMREAQEGKPSVGALIHGQKPRYYSELIVDRYNYALMAKNI